MQQRPRKPGDQAPPPRPTHRNPGATASTHVKDTAGKTFCVVDGETNEYVVINNQYAAGLTYDDARRAKDYAVTKLKLRKASVREETPEAPEEEAAIERPDVAEIDPPSPDPELEKIRQRAVAAAAPVAAAANARVAALPPRPAPAPPPPPKAKPSAKPVQRAPGWEPPPAGVTAARQAPKVDPKAPVVRAPGFEPPRGGAKSTAPKDVEVVGIDPVPVEGDDSLELDDSDLGEGASAADMVSSGTGDLETEVTRKVTEVEDKIKKACAEIKPGDVVYYFGDDETDELAKVVAVHALSCVTLKLGVTDEMIRDDAGKIVLADEAEPVGDLKKSVMLSPVKGKRSNTWQPVV